MGRVEVVLLALIKGLILVWELLTNWAYSLLTNPGDKVKDYSKVLAVPKEEIKENDTEVISTCWIFLNLLLSPVPTPLVPKPLCPIAQPQYLI